jgi:hypothetical protein
VDETGYVIDDNGEQVLKERPVGDTWLHLRFFEHVFDPTVSFDRLGAAERRALQDEIARGDEIDVLVARGAALRSGDRIAAVGDDGAPEVLPYIADVAVRLTDAEPHASYPEVLPTVFLIDGEARLDIVAVTPRLQGELRFTAGSGRSAGTTASETGTEEVVVGFAVELLPERTGECSFDREGAGIVDACSLAPP